MQVAVQEEHLWNLCQVRADDGTCSAHDAAIWLQLLHHVDQLQCLGIWWLQHTADV